MTKEDLSEILGHERIRATRSPLVLEVRPKGILSAFVKYGNRLERMISTFLASYPDGYYCPHEPDEAERSGARHRRWTQGATNTWMIPRDASASDVMYDPLYPHGWTIYSGRAPLDESEWKGRFSDKIAHVDHLIKSEKVVAIVVSDPDGTPWLVGLAEPSGTAK